MKVQLCLSYAKQRNNSHPAKKDIESGHPDVSKIFKTVQIGVQAAGQDANHQTYISVLLYFLQNAIFRKDIVSEQKQYHKLP